MEINWKLIESEIKSNGLTNKKMAELLGIGIATWNRYRTGESDITLKTFYRVLEILDIEYKDAIIDSNIMEYRNYYREARCFDMENF
jgi:transcriptional regulator with XRE-family HTH domain